jgi:class 3 adenylate cyclase
MISINQAVFACAAAGHARVSLRSEAMPSPAAVTFLFTDIEGSTRLWEQFPEAMGRALARHDALLRMAIASNGGTIFKTAGDAFCVAFADAPAAVAAALTAQCSLHDTVWEETGPLRVRMALNSGPVQERGGDFFGPPVNRVARLLAIGHGGQTLLSAAACQEVGDALPLGATLRDLKLHRLKDLPRPERVFQLIHPRLPTEFPPLRSLEVLAEELPGTAIDFIGQERQLADGRGVAVFLEGLAREAGVWGQAERAARLFGAAASLREALGTPRPPSEREDYEAHVTETGAQLGPQAFAEAWIEGAAMTLEQALAYALEERGEE